MHFSSEIAELLREWGQLRAEMERLHCQFKASHDHCVEAGLKSMKTRAGSLLHEIQTHLKAKDAPPPKPEPKPKPQKLQGTSSFDSKLRPMHYTGRASGKKSPYEKEMWSRYSDLVVIDFTHSEE